MTNNKDGQGFIDQIKGLIFHPKESEDIVSRNTKIVIFGLFTLIGFAVLLYAATVTVKYNPETETSVSEELFDQTILASDELSDNEKIKILNKPSNTSSITNSTLSNSKKVAILDDLDQAQMVEDQTSSEQTGATECSLYREYNWINSTRG